MTTALHGWLNRAVKITLQAATPAAVQGTLFHVDDAGVLLERPAGKLFVPFAAILHIESRDALEPDPERHELAAAGHTAPEHACFWRPQP